MFCTSRDMEEFLSVAGVVGFVASQDSLINLFNRVESLLMNADSDYSYENSRFLSCKQRFHMSIGEGDGVAARRQDTEHVKEVRLKCIAAVMKKLEEISRELGHARDVRGRVMKMPRERINNCLDATDKLINDLCALNSCSSSSTAVGSVLADAEHARMKLLASLLRPENKKPLGKKEMRKEGLYMEGTEIRQTLAVSSNSAPPRFISWEGKAYIVERVEFGSTHKEKEKRQSRLGRLILNMRQWEDPCVAKMTFIVETQDEFCIMSELVGSSSFRPLEDALVECRNSVQVSSNSSGSGINGSFVYSGRDDPYQKMSLLISIASAINTLHEQMILHEGIGSHNVLVSVGAAAAEAAAGGGYVDQQLQVKLAGFVSARMVDDSSDRPASTACMCQQAKLLERRKEIYQAPWRNAGSRYSFECDVYSFGVVMAELQCVASFVHTPSIDCRDHILAALMIPQSETGSSSAIAALAQECMSAVASMVPPISEVLRRLQEIHI